MKYLFLALRVRNPSFFNPIFYHHPCALTNPEHPPPECSESVPPQGDLELAGSTSGAKQGMSVSALCPHAG